MQINFPTEIGLGEWFLIGQLLAAAFGIMIGWLMKHLSKRNPDEIVKDLKKYQARAGKIDWQELKRRVENERSERR